MHSAPEVVRHYRLNLQRAEDLATGWGTLEGDLGRRIEQLAARRAQTLERLAQAYVPGLDADTLANAERLTGFRGFSRRDPLKAMEHERHTLTHRVAAIEASEQYVRRFALVGSAGEYTRAVEELQELERPWRVELDKYELLDGFLELIEVGYDTPQFADRWWQPIYWKHWGQGDDVCRELGMKDFGDDVLPAYREVKAKHDEVHTELRRALARKQAVHDLVQERDEAVARVPRLPQIFLEGAQGFLARFLDQADLPLLAEWLEDDRAIEMNLRVAIGLASQVQRLEELVLGVKAQREEMARRAAKYQRKIVKFQRSKYAYQQFGDNVLDLGLAAKEDKYRRRLAKTRKLAERIADWDDHADWDLAADPHAWWHDAVGKAPPESLMPKTARWYVKPPPGSMPARAVQEAVGEAAAALTDLDDVGYLS